jgi:hypothetical protein
VAVVRTIRFTVNSRLNPDMNLSLSTEEIFSDDDPEVIREAGRAAMIAISFFMNGVNSAEPDNEEGT